MWERASTGSCGSATLLEPQRSPYVRIAAARTLLCYATKLVIGITIVSRQRRGLTVQSDAERRAGAERRRGAADLHGRVPNELSPRIDDASENGEDDDSSTERGDGNEDVESPVTRAFVESTL